MTHVATFVASAEGQATLARIAAKTGTAEPVSGSRCAACPKILEETECAIRGYGSGKELGLCRKCASFVNTREAIKAAEEAGFKVHAKPITLGVTPAASDDDSA